MKEKKKKTEQCFCQSYYDDDSVLQNCTCGKCGTKMSKTKLNKAQNKRFDEKYPGVIYTEFKDELQGGILKMGNVDQRFFLKQHLADELAREKKKSRREEDVQWKAGWMAGQQKQKKEIIEKLEKLKGIGDDFPTRTANNAIDQAIKKTKEAIEGK